MYTIYYHYMSDIHVDKISNSQLVLLVLLISLVVSAATAVATLSVVYERLALEVGGEAEAQPTVIRQTINRIIEREPTFSSPESIITSVREVSSAVDTALTLEMIEQSLVQLYFGSQPFAEGMYVSADGHILAAEVLDAQRRYSVLDETGNPMFFSTLHSGKEYSLLAPVEAEAHTVQHYVPLERSAEVLLGQAVVVFSGSGNNARLHTGVISQRETAAGEVESFRISVNASDITDISVVFVENTFVGFARPYSDWVRLPGSVFITEAIQAIQGKETKTDIETATEAIPVATPPIAP